MALLGRELQVKGVRAVSFMPGFAEQLKVFERVQGEQWVQAAGAHADRSVTTAMRASDADVDSDVKAALWFLSMVSKTCPGTSAERNLQYKHLVGQVWAHGPGVALGVPGFEWEGGGNCGGQGQGEMN